MLDDVEVVLLTGGASRRMGEDKATLSINGVAQGERMIYLLTEAGYTVTTIGRRPLGEARFLQDQEEFSGPLTALALFKPRAPTVMVLSCDMPLFDPAIIGVLERLIGEDEDANLPRIGGRLQPLVGLYRDRTWHSLRRLVESGERRLMAWVECLRVKNVSEAELKDAGIDLLTLRSANSPDELQVILAHSHGTSQ